MSILVIGSLNTDLIFKTLRLPRPGESLTSTSFHTAPGGKGANQAVSCARLSHGTATTVSMIGSVGHDAFAAPLLSALRDSGVDTSRIATNSVEPTGTAAIIVDSSGENHILIHPGANATVLPEMFPDDFFVGGGWSAVVLQLEIRLDTVLRVLRLAKREGVRTVLNPAPAIPLPDEAFRNADWFVVNETEAALLTGMDVEMLERSEGVVMAAAQLLGRGCGAVVVTLGGRGCYWSVGSEHGWVEAEVEKEAVVDTTGAGDTFVGALTVAVVEGREKVECVQFAVKAAGRAVRKSGAMAGVPWRAEVV